MKSKPTNSRRRLLKAGLLGLAGGAALEGQSGEQWRPKKEVAGLKPGQSPKPGGLLSGCIRSGHLLFLSGIGGWYPERRKEPGDVKVQIRGALESMKQTLEKAGSSMDNVLKVTIALVDVAANFEPMNEAYREFFSNIPPARSVFPAAGFRRKEQLLQMDAIAYVD